MESKENAREHFRVPAKVRVFFCEDSPEARNSMVTDYAVWTSHPSEMPEASRTALTDINNVHEGLKPLYAMMQWLNFKMDTVLYQLRVVSRSNIFTENLITTDISLNGFGFDKVIDAAVGSKLLLALHLPDEPVHPVYTVGILVRNSQGSGEAVSPGAVVFDELSDSDRERIARFAFSFERKLKGRQE